GIAWRVPTRLADPSWTSEASLTSISSAVIEPSDPASPFTSTVAPTASVPSSCSISVELVTWTVVPETTQSPTNPGVDGSDSTTPVSLASDSWPSSAAADDAGANAARSATSAPAASSLFMTHPPWSRLSTTPGNHAGG